ncbi:MAG TPA: tRNA 2-thiouridine(34) synthase MnmA, partial [Firmicutes bacterium]|nr:tRNA 2-thiouridine(34) synthase MnmA [Bacillota bacterium]
ARLPATPGPILDMDGNLLGTHRGLANYTVGQRKGLGIAVGKPLFVVRLDTENNALIVGGKDDVTAGGLIAADVNLILYDRLEATLPVTVKIRYLAKEADATITPLEDGRVRVDFARPERAVTPGQSVVFYQGDDVVGGGIIQEAIR